MPSITERPYPGSGPREKRWRGGRSVKLLKGPSDNESDLCILLAGAFGAWVNPRPRCSRSSAGHNRSGVPIQVQHDASSARDDHEGLDRDEAPQPALRCWAMRAADQIVVDLERSPDGVGKPERKRQISVWDLLPPKREPGR